jgi:NCAIR mutase (PurE)-related protein
MRDVLRRLLAGELNVEEAEAELRRVQLEELDGRARLDLGRAGRRGLAEVVLATGKTPQELARLAVSLAREQGQGLASRLGPDHWTALESARGELLLQRYGSAARLLRPGFQPSAVPARVGILTAGTSDLDAAGEAQMVVEASGLQARVEADLGVAGLHRLIGPLAELLSWPADVLVVAAGMDGVLPGVVAGLVELPVIGLPISTGYGLGGAGQAALMSMLQSCSTGLVVVNVDNGVGAGAAAALIARRVAAGRQRQRAPGRDRRAAPRPGPRAGSASG